MLLQKSRIPIKQIILYGFLPSPLKIFLYRLKGFKIGKKVRIGFGSVVCADDVEIGRYTRIDFFTIIRGKKVQIGSHVSIGSTTFIDTPYIEIGDECKINEQVFIGGLQLQDSKFVLGNNCQIMQMSFINPAKSIVIGDDSAIGGHCLLFGHNSWLSCFEGYDVVFKPITIGKSVALSWRVFILPGVEIGDGSVIAPESLVSRSIPAKSLAAGYPAKVISKYPNFPKEVPEEQKGTMLKGIVDEMVAFFNGSGLVCNKKNEIHEIVQTKNTILGKRIKTWRMKVTYDVVDEEIVDHKINSINLLVSLKTIPEVVRVKLNNFKIVWLDIEKKERALFGNDLGDEVALFIRRYGVRFSRA
jgi:acetyltransferase-like isoleucine patch superfamily enzyme